MLLWEEGRSAGASEASACRSCFDEAKQAALNALKIKPKLGHAYCALGRVAAQKGEDAEAEKDFVIAIKADRHDDDAFGGMGDLLMKRRDYKTAIDYYERAAHIVPDERVWHEKLRDAFAAQGDRANAAREAARIAELSKAPAEK